MVRTQLRALLKEGINPLTFFDRDYKKYFYLAGAGHALFICCKGIGTAWVQRYKPAEWTPMRVGSSVLVGACSSPTFAATPATRLFGPQLCSASFRKSSCMPFMHTECMPMVCLSLVVKTITCKFIPLCPASICNLRRLQSACPWWT